MAAKTIEWTYQAQAIASQALLRVWPGEAESGGHAVFSYETWADIIVHLVREASHMALLAATAETMRDNGETVSPTHPQMVAALATSEFPVGAREMEEFLKERAGPGTALGEADVMWFVAQACARKIYRTARRTRHLPIAIFPELLPPPMGAVPGGYRAGCGEQGRRTFQPPGTLPEDQGWASEGGTSLPPSLLEQRRGCDLGVAHIWIAAIVLVGIAAVAAGAWYGSESSDDMARVDIDTAKSAAKSQIAIEIAKAQIAKGLPVSIPSEIMDWGRAEERNTSPWFMAATGVVLVAVAGGASYVGHKLGGGKKRSGKKSATGAA